MKVSEIMHKLLTCDENLELCKAIEIMVTYDRGSVVVMRKEKPVGIFTERDGLRLIVSRRKCDSLKVKDVMTPLLYTADEDMPVMEASRLMEEKRVRRLPIIDKSGILVGMVTAASIAKSKKYMMARNLSSGLSSGSIY